MILRYIKRFPHALRAIWYAIRHDFSFRAQLLTITPAIVVFGYFFWPLTETEILFLGLAYALILVTELQNSAHEIALDRLHPDQHQEIGRSKDIAAGAVLGTGMFLIFVMIVITCF